MVEDRQRDPARLSLCASGVQSRKPALPAQRAAAVLGAPDRQSGDGSTPNNYSTAPRGRLITDVYPGVGAAMLHYQGVELGGMTRVQPHAAMRDWPTERVGLIGAVDRIAAVEENRVWHGRIVVLA